MKTLRDRVFYLGTFLTILTLFPCTTGFADEYQILRREGDKWKVLPGKSIEIAAGADGSVWVLGTVKVNGGHQVLKWNGANWDRIDGGLIRIAVDSKGNVLGVNEHGTIFRRNGLRWDGFPGTATEIAAGADGSIWILDSVKVAGGYQILKWNGTKWDRVDGGFTKIAVDSKGVPWGIKESGDIFRRKGDKWEAIPSKASAIAAGADGSVWMLGTDKVAGGHSVSKWNGSKWETVDGGATRIAVDSKGVAWSIKTVAADIPAEGDGPLAIGLPPTFGQVVLKAGFIPDPHVKALMAGGPVKANLGGVNANYTKAPSFSLHYKKGGFPLTIYVEAEEETPLLVKLPNGSWMAHAGGKGQSILRFAQPQSGRYCIYIGNAGAGTVPATLKITELPVN